ncbi:MAG: hypothetical protein HPY71_13200 [Firmicutes bacterium]|nr:hypothetical protein [Bacillota bacterium]
MKELSPRERLLRLFDGKDVDRLPASPFIHTNFVKEFFKDPDVDLIEGTVEVYKHFGFDVIHRNCTPSFGESMNSGPDWQVRVSESECEKEQVVITTIETPEGELRQVLQRRKVSPYETIEAITEAFIKTREDFELFLKYQPPVPKLDTKNVTLAKKVTGEYGIVAPWVSGAFGFVVYYRKLEDLLMDAMLESSFYHEMLEYFTARCRDLALQVATSGADIVAYNANIANGKVVSPGFFRQHVFKYEKAVIEAIQSEGIPVLYHNCGPARVLLDIYPGLGMRAYESLSPPPVGDTVLEEALKRLGGEMILSGNIDQVYFLRQASPHEIEKEVKRVMDSVRYRGKFILATTDYLHEGTPYENIFALAEAGKRYGAYA